MNAYFYRLYKNGNNALMVVPIQELLLVFQSKREKLQFVENTFSN